MFRFFCIAALCFFSALSLSAQNNNYLDTLDFKYQTPEPESFTVVLDGKESPLGTDTYFVRFGIKAGAKADITASIAFSPREVQNLRNVEGYFNDTLKASKGLSSSRVFEFRLNGSVQHKLKNELVCIKVFVNGSKKPTQTLIFKVSDIAGPFKAGTESYRLACAAALLQGIDNGVFPSEPSIISTASDIVNELYSNGVYKDDKSLLPLIRRK